MHPCPGSSPDCKVWLMTLAVALASVHHAQKNTSSPLFPNPLASHVSLLPQHTSAISTKTYAKPRKMHPVHWIPCTKPQQMHTAQRTPCTRPQQMHNLHWNVQVKRQSKSLREPLQKQLLGTQRPRMRMPPVPHHCHPNVNSGLALFFWTIPHLHQLTGKP